MLFTYFARLAGRASISPANKNTAGDIPSVITRSLIAVAGALAIVVHASPHRTTADATHDVPALAHVVSADSQESGSGDLVAEAVKLLDVPYRWGGTSAETGFDCSGFVRAVYDKALGPVLPRTAAQQAAATKKIARSELEPGDLVFFNTRRHRFSHVGIYMGDGNFIHAPKPGARVRIEKLGVKYWSSRFTSARRVQEVQIARNTSASKAVDGAGVVEL
ncbi:MAG: C40 family peptidase [Variovorax sp.]|nr:C40 family peptidase [Variovorax sp.]